MDPWNPMQNSTPQQKASNMKKGTAEISFVKAESIIVGKPRKRKNLRASEKPRNVEVVGTVVRGGGSAGLSSNTIRTGRRS
jgi:hypothetical protein